MLANFEDRLFTYRSLFTTYSRGEIRINVMNEVSLKGLEGQDVADLPHEVRLRLSSPKYSPKSASPGTP